MKTFARIQSIALLLGAAVISASFIGLDGCDPSALLKKNTPALQEYTFVKSFPVEIKKNGEKSEYSYVMSKDTKYRLVVCDGDGTNTRMIVNVYDRDKKLIISNFTRRNKVFSEKLDFDCKATGVYYVESFFENENKGCGLNILGYKK